LLALGLSGNGNGDDASDEPSFGDYVRKVLRTDDVSATGKTRVSGKSGRDRGMEAIGPVKLLFQAMALDIGIAVQHAFGSSRSCAAVPATGIFEPELI